MDFSIPLSKTILCTEITETGSLMHKPILMLPKFAYVVTFLGTQANIWQQAFAYASETYFRYFGAYDGFT